MRKHTMLNRILACGLAAALFVSSPITAFADEISDDVNVETSVENTSEGVADSADSDSAANDSNSEESSSDEAGQTNSDGSLSEENSSTNNEVNKDNADDKSGASVDKSSNEKASEEPTTDEQVTDKEVVDESELTPEELEKLEQEKLEKEKLEKEKLTEEDKEIEYSYSSNGDGTHTKKWVDEDGVEHEEIEDCEFDEDGVCIHCGYENPEYEMTISDSDGIVNISGSRKALNGAKSVKVEEITVESDENQYFEMSDALEEKTDDETSVIDFAAYDIKLFDEDDDEVEPDGEVKVVFNNPSVDGLDDEEYETEVFHYEDSENVNKMEDVKADDNSVEMTTTHFSTYIVAITGRSKGEIFHSQYVTITSKNNTTWKKVDEIPSVTGSGNNKRVTVNNKSYKSFYPTEFRIYFQNSSKPVETFSVAYPDKTDSTFSDNLDIYSEDYTIELVRYKALSSYDKSSINYRCNKPKKDESTYNFSFENYISTNNTNYIDIYVVKNEYLNDVYTVSGATLINYKNYIDAGKVKNSNTRAFGFVESGVSGHDNSGNSFEGDNYHESNIFQGLASDTYNGTFELASNLTRNIDFFPSESAARNNDNYTQADYDVNVQFKKEGNYYVLDSSRYGYDLIQDDGESATKQKITKNATLKVKSNVEKTTGNSPVTSFFPYQIEGDGFHFGMNIPLEFAISADGKTDGQNTKFEFSGDDDVFVYIGDGNEEKLVLDLGGIHKEVQGSIDFATGIVHVAQQNYKKNSYNNNYSAVTVQDFDVYELLGTTREQFSKTTHTLRVIYFERGAGQNNCKIKYNFVPINNKKNFKKDLTIQKVWDDNNSSSRPTSLTFRVFGTFADGSATKYINLSGQVSDQKIYTEETVTAAEGWTKKIHDIPVFYNDDTNKLITWTVEEDVPDGYELTDYQKSFSENSSITTEDLIPIPASEGGEYYSHFDVEVNAVKDDDTTGARTITDIRDLKGNENSVSVIGYFEGNKNNHTWQSKTKQVSMYKHNAYEWRANTDQPIGENTIVAFYVKYSGTFGYKLVTINKNSQYPTGAKYFWHSTEFAMQDNDPYYTISGYYTGTMYSAGTNIDKDAYVDLSGKNLFRTALLECPETTATSKGHYKFNGLRYDAPGLDFVLSPKTIETISIEGTGHELHKFTNKIVPVTNLTFKKTVVVDGTNPYTNALYNIKLEKITNEDGQEKAEIVNYFQNSGKVFIGSKEITKAKVTSKQGNNTWNPGCVNGVYSIYDNQSVTITGLPTGTYRIIEVGTSNDVELAWFDTEIVCDGQTTTGLTATIDCAEGDKEVDVRNILKKTFSWKLKKVSASNHNTALKDAEFKLSSQTATYYGLSGDDGIVVWYTDKSFADDKKVDEVADGTYTLEETKAPKAYARSTEQWTVSVEKYKSVEVKNGDVTIAKTDANNTIIEVEFENTVEYTLPETGGSGVYVYTIGGILLMIAGALLLYKNKNNKKQ